MAAGQGAPDPPAVAERAVREAVAAARDARRAELPLFAGGKSFGGRMTSRAHAAAPLPRARARLPRLSAASRRGSPAIERAEHLAQATGPMLFLQGTRDDLADLALLRPVVKGLGARATLHVVEGADHGFDALRCMLRSSRRRSRAWIDRDA